MRRPRIHAVAFLASGTALAAEVVAPRVLASAVGGTAYVWAATIVVFLVGMAFGAGSGGRLADRGGRHTLSVLFVVAGAWLLGAGPALDAVAGSASHLGVIAAAPLLAAIGFLVPSLALGAAGTLLAHAALSAGATEGRAIGRVQLAGNLGAAAGTLATGFLAVPALGLRAILLVLGALLFVAAALAARAKAGDVAASPPPAPPSAEPGPRGGVALAALAGAALLVVEIVAVRRAALWLGASIYTWTSVLAVVLGGSAVGAGVGGRIADHGPPRRALARLFLLATIATAATLWTSSLLGVAEGLPLPLGPATLTAVVLAFGPASVALGALPPAIVRAALAGSGTRGAVVGRLYAAGTFGAVGGALLATLVWIPLLGTHTALLVVALALAFAADRVRGTAALRPTRVVLAVLALVAVVPGAPASGGLADVPRRLGLRLGLRDDADGVLVREGFFSRVRVSPVDDHPTRRRMTIDRLVHGSVDLEDPTWLEYDYERVAAAVVERLWPQGGANCLFVGGGAYTFQRRLLALHADARCVTAEIEPAVTRAAREALDLRTDDRHVVRHEDARTVLFDEADGGPYTFVFGDAFDDVSVPAHLTTVEVARRVAALVPRGAYLVNVVDVWRSGRFLAAMLATLEEAFAHVEVLTLGPRDADADETFLLVASQQPLPLGGLVDDAGRPLRIERYEPEELRTLKARTGAFVLTDDFAPVEALLAPVARRRGPGVRR